MIKAGNTINDDDDDDDVSGIRENEKPTQKNVLLSRDILKNYVSKFKSHIGVQIDGYFDEDDDDSIEDVRRNVESRDKSQGMGKALGRDILTNYVLKKANTFRAKSKKYVEYSEDEGIDELDIDDDDDDDEEEDSDNLDLLIIDDFPYQLSEYIASIKLKEVLLGNQCKYKLICNGVTTPNPNGKLAQQLLLILFNTVVIQLNVLFY